MHARVRSDGVISPARIFLEASEIVSFANSGEGSARVVLLAIATVAAEADSRRKSRRSTRAFVFAFVRLSSVDRSAVFITPFPSCFGGPRLMGLADFSIELLARSREQTGLAERNLTRISIGLKAIFSQALPVRFTEECRQRTCGKVPYEL
jgi:hypothetical protein